MPSIQAILSVLVAGFALSATPGPSMLYVLSHSIGQSRAAGLASALGLCLGGILLAIATAFGLATLFFTFDWLVVVLRYLGSAYLIWLGARMIFTAKSHARTEFSVVASRQSSLFTIVQQGILVELLNPKTVLFFALFIPPFVSLNETAEQTRNVTLQLLILGSLVPLTAVPADIAVAFLGSAVARAVNNQQTAREVMAWFGGVLLIVIALSLHVHLIS